MTSTPDGCQSDVYPVPIVCISLMNVNIRQSVAWLHVIILGLQVPTSLHGHSLFPSSAIIFKIDDPALTFASKYLPLVTDVTFIYLM